MHNIGSVIAFALHNKGFGPNHFFRRAKFHREAENLPGHCVSEPKIVNLTKAVSRVEDNINETILAMHLPQPVRKREFALKSRVIESRKDFLKILLLDN